MTRDELCNALNISEADSIIEIYEKLFCASLLSLGTDITAKVLSRYNEMKEVLFNG